MACRHREATSAHGGTVKCMRTQNRWCRFLLAVSDLCRTPLETFPVGEQRPGPLQACFVWAFGSLVLVMPSRAPPLRVAAQAQAPGLAGPKHTPKLGGKEWIACSELASLSQNEGILFMFYMDSFVKTSFCVPIKYMNVQRSES